MTQCHYFTDCGFYFSLENKDGPLTILMEGDERAFTLPSTNCSINASSSMYLDCGTWRSIDKMSLMNKFSLNHWIMDCPVLKVSCLKLRTLYLMCPIKIVLYTIMNLSKHEAKAGKHAITSKSGNRCLTKAGKHVTVAKLGKTYTTRSKRGKTCKRNNRCEVRGNMQKVLSIGRQVTRIAKSGKI